MSFVRMFTQDCTSALNRTKPVVERVCQHASALCAFLIRPWMNACSKTLTCRGPL